MSESQTSFQKLAFGKLYQVGLKQRQIERDAMIEAAAAVVVRSGDGGSRVKSKNKRSRPSKRSQSLESSTQIEFQLTERVDMEALEAIFVRRRELLVQTEATRFATYVEEMRKTGGQRVVTYRQALHGFGRVYADGSLSLANFSRPLRSALCRNLYYDVDMKNAHPRALRAIAELNGWKVPMLNQYIEHRDAAVAEMPYEPSISKQIFLAIINGGSRKSVLEKAQKDNPNIRDLGWTLFAENLKEEMKRLARRVYDTFPKFRDAVSPESNNPRVSVMSFAMQEFETHALMTAARLLRDRGWEVGVFIHDGLLVHRSPEREIDAALLADLKAAVAQECGAAIPFGLKEFEEPLDFHSCSDGVVPVDS